MRNGRVGVAKDDGYEGQVDFGGRERKEDGEDVVYAWVGVEDDLVRHCMRLSVSLSVSVTVSELVFVLVFVLVLVSATVSCVCFVFVYVSKRGKNGE